MVADYVLCDTEEELSWDSGVRRGDFTVLYPVDITGITVRSS
jgi:hypothetical protein